MNTKPISKRRAFSVQSYFTNRERNYLRKVARSFNSTVSPLVRELVLEFLKIKVR